MTIKFYDRTPEQQALLGYLVDPAQSRAGHEGVSSEEVNTDLSQIQRVPHGAIGAAAGHRAITQSNSSEITDSLFRYSAPEEVMTFPPTCGTCAAKFETRMFVTKVDTETPHLQRSTPKNYSSCQ